MGVTATQGRISREVESSVVTESCLEPVTLAVQEFAERGGIRDPRSPKGRRLNPSQRKGGRLREVAVATGSKLA
jgi:hypothetical protein